MIAVCLWVPKYSSVVLQLQIDAVMENAMKIVETEKFSGNYVKCFHSWSHLLKFGSYIFL